MMMVVGYLTFEGDCRAAMEFYAKGLKAEVDLMDASQMPNCPPGKETMVLHARLHRDGTALVMASDNLMGAPVVRGTNFSLSIDCASAEEQDGMMAALGEGGTVTMPLQNTFWGARFGMLTDRFGVGWMLNYDQAQQP